MTTLPQLSLYVHLPWCVRKCPYCDFNSHALKQALPEREYVDALLRDLEFDLPRVQGRKIETVFFGGGTPSLFSAEAIGRLLEETRRRIAFSDDVEITLEANPGTVEHGRFAEYKAAGINRLSIGVQRFTPAHFKVLGRIHDESAATRSPGEAPAAGLANLQLDLLYAPPDTSAEHALADLPPAVAPPPAIAVDAGGNVEFDSVLMVADGDDIKVGAPYVAGGKVTATVKSQGRDDKVMIIKFRRRKHHRKQQGHRQHYTELQITGIQAG